MRNHQYYIQVIIALVGSLLVSKLLLLTVFPTRSPFIRPQLGNYLLTNLSAFVSRAGDLIPRFNISSTPISQPTPFPSNPSPSDMFSPEQSLVASGVRQQLSTQPFVKTSPGIYTTSNDTSSLMVIKQKETPWNEVSVVINGKTIRLRIPAGQSVPTQEMLSQAF